MGATSSIQSPNASKSVGEEFKTLSEEDMVVFTEFEKKCCSMEDITEEKLQNLLYQKYLELVNKKDCVVSVENNANDGEQSAAEDFQLRNTKGTKSPPRHRRPLQRLSQQDRNRRKTLELRQQIFNEYNTLNSEKRSSRRSKSPELGASGKQQIFKTEKIEKTRRRSFSPSNRIQSHRRSMVQTEKQTNKQTEKNTSEKKVKSNSNFSSKDLQENTWATSQSTEVTDEKCISLLAVNLSSTSIDTEQSNEIASETEDEEDENGSVFDAEERNCTQNVKDNEAEASDSDSVATTDDLKMKCKSSKLQLSTIPEFFECKLCKKKFDTRSLLETHLSHSQIHRQSLLELRRRYSSAQHQSSMNGYDKNGVNRLENLAKKVIEKFQSAFQSSQQFYSKAQVANTNVEENSSQGHSVNIARWRRAVRRVINQNLTRRSIDRLHELEAALLAANIALNTGNNKILGQQNHGGAAYRPKLLYEGSKFFWRTKTRFIIYIFVHDLFHCLEIVPLVLHESSTTDSTSKTVIDNDIKESQLPEAKNNAWLSMHTRIYLDLNFIMRITNLESVLSSPQNSQNDDDELANRSTNLVFQDHSSIGNYLSAQALFRDDDNEQENNIYSNANEKSNVSLTKQVIQHIIERLKLDSIAIQSNFKRPEHALYFDDNYQALFVRLKQRSLQREDGDIYAGKIQQLQYRSPLLTSTPLRLCPALIDQDGQFSTGKILSVDKRQVEVKVEEVQQLQQDLSSILSKAEHFANSIHINSPHKKK